MEVPVINRLNDFPMGLNSLQNPSMLSQIQSISVAYTFCKWGALILALLATFGSLVNRFKIFILRFRPDASSLPSLPSLDYSSSDDDDDDDEIPSSPSSSYLSSEFEEEEEEEENETTPSSSSFNWRRVDQDFRVRGSGHQVDEQFQSGNVRLRRLRSIGDIFSLSEIANSSKSVVKLWDSIGFGLGLDFDDVDYDYDFSAVPATTSSSPQPVVVSAEKNASGKTALKICDTRLRRGIPAVIAEWGPSLGKIVGVGFGGVEKFYVGDDAGDDVTVGDMRKVNSPLGNVTESDVDTWWNGDVVAVSRKN
ncbi:uncharacterized protein G2W53_035617 [Senna tora]|uniref:Uncharacterized protein n=1 Tax=Senna tora TaxID=362788 RepID=A0A834T3U6_9FABA|nr:uncharacterized protein G2W53_035617 [Senna tora]